MLGYLAALCSRLEIILTGAALRREPSSRAPVYVALFLGPVLDQALLGKHHEILAYFVGNYFVMRPRRYLVAARALGRSERREPRQDTLPPSRVAVAGRTIRKAVVPNR